MVEKKRGGEVGRKEFGGKMREEGLVGEKERWRGWEERG